MLPYAPRLKQAARRLRRDMTEAEQHLWHRLRRKQILGVQFYRQKAIGTYIVDFYGPTAKLVVEIDGSQHVEPKSAEYDRIRTEYLSELGVSVLRFDNRQVLLESESVLEKIFEVVRERANRK